MRTLLTLTFSIGLLSAQPRFNGLPIFVAVTDNSNPACNSSVLSAAFPASSSTGSTVYVVNTAQTTVVSCRSNGTSWVTAASAGGLSSTLSSGNLFVGNGSNVATGVPLSADCTLANTGAITCTKSSGSAFGTAAFQNTGTSGANVGLLNANLTFGGTDTFTNAPTFSSISGSTQCLHANSSGVVSGTGSDCGSGGGGNLTVEVGGTSTGTASSTLNFIAGAGITQTCTYNAGATRNDCTPAINTAGSTGATSHTQLASSADLVCVDTSGTTSMTCTHSTQTPAGVNWTAYQANQMSLMIPGVASTTNANVDSLGAVNFYDETCNSTTSITNPTLFRYNSSSGRWCKVL